MSVISRIRIPSILPDKIPYLTSPRQGQKTTFAILSNLTVSGVFLLVKFFCTDKTRGYSFFNYRNSSLSNQNEVEVSGMIQQVRQRSLPFLLVFSLSVKGRVLKLRLFRPQKYRKLVEEANVKGDKLHKARVASLISSTLTNIASTTLPIISFICLQKRSPSIYGELFCPMVIYHR